MTDDEDSEEPAVTLGTQRTVDGVPLARVSARLMWGIEQSAVREREGDTVIRTPDGPQELGELLDAADQQYFPTRQEFEDALGEVIGDGPVPVESDDSQTAEDDAATDDEAPESDEETNQTDTDEEPETAEDAKTAEDHEDAETAEDGES